MSNLPISYRLANVKDIPLLAEMNLQLIQDEGSANSMNLSICLSVWQASCKVIGRQ